MRLCEGGDAESNSPVHEYTTFAMQSLLNELVRLRKMLQQVFIVYILEIDPKVLERLEYRGIKR